MLTLEQIRFCAGECERQQVGPLSVADMCDAYITLLTVVKEQKYVYLEDVLEFGRIIEPEKNRNGFRQTPVVIDYRQVPVYDFGRIINLLIHNSQDLAALEGYKRFEEIHPFIDGNGRVGALLYNYWLGNLDHPVQPPKVFN